MAETYHFITQQTTDRESKEVFEFPAEYMFKDVPEKELRHTDDPIATTLARDGPLGHREGHDPCRRRGRHRARGAEAPPRSVRRLDRGRPQQGHGRHPRASPRCTTSTTSAPSTLFPSGTFPQVAINDKLMYPIYAKCVRARHRRVLLRRRARAAAARWRRSRSS